MTATDCRVWCERWADETAPCTCLPESAAAQGIDPAAVVAPYLVTCAAAVVVPRPNCRSTPARLL